MWFSGLKILQLHLYVLYKIAEDSFEEVNEVSIRWCK